MKEQGNMQTGKNKGLERGNWPCLGEDFSRYEDGTETEAADTARPFFRAESEASLFYLCVKRLMDVIISALALILTAPILLAAAIAIKIENPKGKVLFHQPRIGWNCREFHCHKLTSMVPNAEQLLEKLSDEEKKEFAETFKLKHDPRITRVGRFLRKTSIDELPQLWNVLVGEMSLVGPRPPLLAERETYGRHLGKVMSVKPGITGYWQVHGRSDTDFSERIRMAEYYVDHRGIWMDLKILLETVKVVLTGSGAV